VILYTSDGCLYDGMDETTVTQLRGEFGLSTAFVSASEWASYVSAHQPVPLTAPQILAAERVEAVSSFLTGVQPTCKTLRAAALVTMDELNLLRQWITAFKAAVSLAATLADLKTRVAALDSMPDRSASQIKGAIQNKINAGTAD